MPTQAEAQSVQLHRRTLLLHHHLEGVLFGNSGRMLLLDDGIFERIELCHSLDSCCCGAERHLNMPPAIVMKIAVLHRELIDTHRLIGHRSLE